MGYIKDKWIESMEPKPHEWERRWIPVDESLPDIGQVVLVYRPDVPAQSFTVSVCLYSKHLPENEYGFRTDWADDIQPTHWMPLPEPPDTRDRLREQWERIHRENGTGHRASDAGKG